MVERLDAVGGGLHLVPAGDQGALERAADLRFVVHDEDQRHRWIASGSEKAKVAPPPGVSSIQSSPPIRSTNPFAIARPSPGPRFDVRSSSR